jgi:hypothetical protein
MSSWWGMVHDGGGVPGLWPCFACQPEASLTCYWSACEPWVMGDRYEAVGNSFFDVLPGRSQESFSLAAGNGLLFCSKQTAALNSCF